jgi:hypothetical protein
MASIIPSPGMGVWSQEYPVFCGVVCFLSFTGVPREVGVTTSVARTAPRLVRFLVHVTRWNCGETECSRTRFLDMLDIAVRKGSRVWE